MPETAPKEKLELKPFTVDLVIDFSELDITKEVAIFPYCIYFTLNRKRHYKLYSLSDISFKWGNSQEEKIAEIHIPFTEPRNVFYPKPLATFLAKSDPNDVKATLLPYFNYAWVEPEHEHRYFPKYSYTIKKMVIHYDGKDFVIV